MAHAAERLFPRLPVKDLSKAAFSSSIRQACTAEGGKVGIDASKMVLTQGPLCAMEGGAFTLEGARCTSAGTTTPGSS